MALQEVSKKVAAAHDTDEVLDLIVNESARLVGADGAIMRLVDGDELVVRAATESAADYIGMAIANPRAATGQAVVSQVMATKKPIYGEDIDNMGSPE